MVRLITFMIASVYTIAHAHLSSDLKPMEIEPLLKPGIIDSGIHPANTYANNSSPFRLFLPSHSMQNRPHYINWQPSAADLVSTANTISSQNHSSDAGRVTFGKIALEMAGAAACGLLAVNITHIPVEYRPPWWLANPIGIFDYLFLLSFPISSAVATTLIGNAVMQPNGSFFKSFIGSTLGALIAMVLDSAILFPYFFVWEPGRQQGDDLLPVLVAAAVVGTFFPASGAVIGYNCSIRRNATKPSYNFHDENELFKSDCRQHLQSLKIELVSIKF